MEIQRLELDRYLQEKERSMQDLEHQLQLQEISLMNREVQQEEEQEGYYSKLRGEQTRMSGRMQVCVLRNSENQYSHSTAIL